jgi:hypothetical protein|tara:strand:- start:507 stop:1004 length:498 start_codon:yes stop_codon:yes gene_type:complete
MKTKSIGYHNRSLVFSADIQVSAPESGFLFQIGRSGDPDFYPAISFSGSEGFIFDQEGEFVGGYRQNQLFNISGNYFYGDQSTSGNLLMDHTGEARFSYFLNGNLISNNINGQTGFLQTIRFEDHDNQNNLFFEIVKETGSSNVIRDSGSTYLASSEGHYLGYLD